MSGKPVLGIVAGFVAALIGAAIWATVTVLTGYQIGWMAIGVGFLVGVAVRIAGKGSQPVFGIIGAGFALLGCVLGNLFSGIGFLAKEEEIGYLQMLGEFNWSASFALLGAMFSPIDLLFYGIAIYQGFKVSIAVDAE